MVDIRMQDVIEERCRLMRLFVGIKCVLNSISQENNIRKIKADKIHIYVITKILVMQGNLRFASPFDLEMIALKTLGWFWQKKHKARNPHNNPTD